MQIIKKICYSSCLLLSLTACTNALYFYETDKISLTLEARPDSSQPVQGNFGLKQRIALVTPSIKKNSTEGHITLLAFCLKENKEEPTLTDIALATYCLNEGKEKDDDMAIVIPCLNKNKEELTIDDTVLTTYCLNQYKGKLTEEGGEAISSIASFRFTKEPGAFGDIGDVTIKTAFITGAAAANLNHDAIGAALAIVGDNKARNIDASISALTNAFDMMTADTTNTRAQELVAQLNSIGQFIIPDEYPLTLYHEVPNLSSELIELKEEHKVATSTSAITRDVAGVAIYLDHLDNAVKVLERAILTPNKYSLGGQTLNNPVSLAGLKVTLANTKLESNKAHDKLLDNAIYQKSIEFYIDNYLLSN